MRWRFVVVLLVAMVVAAGCSPFLQFGGGTPVGGGTDGGDGSDGVDGSGHGSGPAPSPEQQVVAAFIHGFMEAFGQLDADRMGEFYVPNVHFKVQLETGEVTWDGPMSRAAMVARWKVEFQNAPDHMTYEITSLDISGDTAEVALNVNLIYEAQLTSVQQNLAHEVVEQQAHVHAVRLLAVRGEGAA